MPAELEHRADVDPAREIAFIAVAADGDGNELQLGVARCALDDEDPTRWDFAVSSAMPGKARAWAQPCCGA